MNIWSSEIKELNQIYQTVKGTIPQLEKELGKLVATDDENMLLVYARRCLEVIITELCENELKRHRGSEPLQRIIDKLNKEEIVPHNIIVSMQGVNSMSTFGAHPKEFELKQVKPVLSNLETILNWYLKYKEILTPGKVSTEKVLHTPTFQKSTTGKYLSRKTILVGLIGIILVLALIIFIPKLIQKMIPETSASEIVRKAIAVLPVSNLTGDPNLEYIAAGFQDDLIGKFGAISSLTVRPTPSTLQFKDSKETPKQMAEKLSVNNMIQSSIKGSEENLQIEVRLIEAFPEERYVWNHSYKLSWDSIGNIYNEILNHIIDIINVEPTSQEATNLTIIKKHDPDLLKACAQGRY